MSEIVQLALAYAALIVGVFAVAFDAATRD